MSTIERNVTVSNIGPVEHLELPAPRGKVVVLRGRNGAGKTRTLEAVSAHVSGRGNVDVRDGAVRGEVEGFGATLKVARRNTRAGELEVVSLEGRFDVSTLVDPELKSDEAADGVRIKALVQLAGGAGADPALFYPILGGQKAFEDYISPASVETPDLVTMAARIKRDLEKHARLEADKATRAVAAAEAARATASDVDTSGPDDAAALQAELEFAIGEHSRLKAQAESITQRLAAAESARRQLAESQNGFSGMSIDAAKAAEQQALAENNAATAEVGRLEDLLQQARNAAELAHMRWENSVNAVRAAIEHGHTVGAWREAIDAAANIEPIPAELLDEAAADVTAARIALERGALIRQAKANHAEADELMRVAAAHRTTSDWLRDCGHATDEVLSDMVSKLGCPLSVSGGRLVTEHPTRGQTFYSELSDGERWKIALDIAIDAVGPNGVLTIKQDAWQDLDPNNQQLIVDHVAQTDVTLYTAACDDGELRAEVA
jgi:hypothetical protein